MKLYTPPQIIFGKALGLSEADIATRMSRVYSERFQLTANEVGLVRKHFNQPDPVRAEELASVRTTFNFARSVTAWELTNYLYPNGHQGTYPLDANSKGILNWPCGVYNMGSEHLKLPEEVDDYPEYHSDEDEKRLKLFDTDHLKLRAMKLAEIRTFE